ncbi:MAG TPA: VOC family protein [Novosphingobium sp.]|nr:VOC family protein [Novosphingobium sp.]
MTQAAESRFGFPRIVVHDLQKQAAFYRAVFGYGEGITIKAEIKGRPLEEVLLGPDGGKIEFLLLAFPGEPAPSPSGVLLGFNTADLDAFEARVVTAGGSVYQEIGPMQMGEKATRMAFYSDPEGFLFEVIEG